MSVKSMTGFGRSEREIGGCSYVVELRCVNNRYLDLKMKLPRGYTALEDHIRKKVAGCHLRGRVDLLLAVSGEQAKKRTIRVNRDASESYVEAIRQLAAQFELAVDFSVMQLAALPDVIISEEQQEDLDALWPALEPLFQDALTHCQQMRSDEGELLAADLRSRLQYFTETVDGIEKQVPTLVAQRQSAMQERLVKLLGQTPLDEDRLAQEVAIIADKTDVTEEIVRLRSHITQFTRFLDLDGAVGRKLDFLVQEFLREVNTIASKINDAAIAHHTVELKSELEKMREQVQNIE